MNGFVWLSLSEQSFDVSYLSTFLPLKNTTNNDNSNNKNDNIFVLSLTHGPLPLHNYCVRVCVVPTAYLVIARTPRTRRLDKQSWEIHPRGHSVETPLNTCMCMFWRTENIRQRPSTVLSESSKWRRSEFNVTNLKSKIIVKHRQFFERHQAGNDQRDWQRNNDAFFHFELHKTRTQCFVFLLTLYTRNSDWYPAVGLTTGHLVATTPWIKCCVMMSCQRDVNR